MKQILTALLLLTTFQFASAQTWSTTGNAGTTPGTNFIGTTDAKDFVFKTNNTEKGRVKSNGLWQFGATVNFAKIDSGGKLTFAGNGAYQVAGNKYAFQYAGNPNYGLFFNSTSLLYEFRTSTALSVFSVGANSGNGIFKGTLKIGAYTLPATDGTNGQVLQTNGTGTVAWATVSGGSGANTALSNLTTTSINQNLIPASTSTFNFGSSSKYWNDIYANGIIYHNGNKFIQSPGSDLTFVGQNAGNNNTGTNNTFIGGGAGYVNTSGYSNTFVGAGCGGSNIGGNANCFFGTGTAASNSSGNHNTIMGYNAGGSNVDGNYNSMFGSGVGVANVSGSYNSMFGYQSGSYNTGSYNSFFGINSGFSNTSGASNIFIGESAGMANTIGASNTFVGASAGRITTADNNTFVGASAGRNTSTGTENVFTGYQAGYYNDDGTWNVFNGAYSGYNNSTGDNNTFIGKNSGVYNTGGSSNVMIGFNTGTSNSTGSNNVFIGSNAYGVASGSFQINNSVAIGAGSLVGQSNSIVLGAIGTMVGINTSTPSSALAVYTASGTGVTAVSAESSISGGNGAIIQCNIGSTAYGVWGISSTGYAGYFTGNVGYTGTIANVSDSKFKENVQPLNDALSKIEMLNAKTYTFKPEYSKMNLPKGTQFGFIAQDLEKVFPELVLTGYDKSMDEKNPMEYKSVNYIGMIPVLTEAIKEQQQQIADRDSVIAQQQKSIDDMNVRMNQFEQSLMQCCTNYQSSSTEHQASNINLQTPSLEQNVPNPFSQTAVIRYYLPSNTTTAQITISDLNGRVLKTFSLAGTGVGQVNINGGELASGTYQYTLLVNNVKVDTKQMILTK